MFKEMKKIELDLECFVWGITYDLPFFSKADVSDCQLKRHKIFQISKTIYF